MLGRQVGNYIITRRLAAGGMGEVFTGKHKLIGHEAAIKMLLPHVSQRHGLVRRFFREAKATAAIGHSGIVNIFDFGYHTDGRAYLVMELLTGESLGERLKRPPRLPLDHTLVILEQVCSALGAAHNKRVVHRDLKPDNIFLQADPDALVGVRAKLLDFGIAKLQDDSPDNKTNTDVIIGTPAYMSPEQSRGAGHVDHRSDLYSLGCIFFEMVCGRRPFVAQGPGQLIGMHQYEPPPRPGSIAADIPPPVEALILQLLVKNPDERIASAQALRAHLAELVDEYVPHATGRSNRASLPVIAGSPAVVTPPPSGPTPGPTLGGATAAGATEAGARVVTTLNAATCERENQTLSTRTDSRTAAITGIVTALLLCVIVAIVLLLDHGGSGDHPAAERAAGPSRSLNEADAMDAGGMDSGPVHDSGRGVNPKKKRKKKRRKKKPRRSPGTRMPGDPY